MDLQLIGNLLNHYIGLSSNLRSRQEHFGVIFSHLLPHLKPLIFLVLLHPAQVVLTELHYWDCVAPPVHKALADGLAVGFWGILR